MSLLTVITTFFVGFWVAATTAASAAEEGE